MRHSRNMGGEILTVAMVAEWLMCSRQTVLEAIRSGRLIAGKLGRTYRIRASEVVAFLDSSEPDWDGWDFDKGDGLPPFSADAPNPKTGPSPVVLAVGWECQPPGDDDHGHNLGDGWDCPVCAKYRRLKRETKDVSLDADGER